ncbi:MAG TPA: hypothetical protein VKP30_13285 [Polyangiaceae bacterium]|nr:hypothetical protein [Polyangiaceae bacterium]
MHLVAITELSSDFPSPQLKALADDLGTTAYELRLILNAGLPAVVLATTDESQAQSACAAITRHGHRALSCDRDRIVPSSSLVVLREFELTSTALLADRGASLTCSYEDISVLLRATHRTVTEQAQEVKERKLRPVMALATGGLVMSKTTIKAVTSTSAQREQVLYIFSRSNDAPWLLRERSARYTGLGPAMAPSSFANFAATVTRLRSLAGNAKYDERLVTNRPIRGLADDVEATDCYAWLLAQQLRGEARR